MTKYASPLVEDPNAPSDIITNDLGAKQSLNTRAWARLPGDSLALISAVLWQGAQKYEDGANGANWRNISWKDHVEHAIEHIFACLECMEHDEFKWALTHLTHAGCRILFALATLNEELEGK